MNNKKKRFPLTLAILLPLFAAILLGEIGLYFAAYFVLNDTVTQNAITDDQTDLAQIKEEVSGNNYAMLGYSLVPEIYTYEQNKPAAPFVPGSKEENDYRELMVKSTYGQLYEATKHTLDRFITTFVGFFYEDLAANRMVLTCSSNLDGEDARNIDAQTVLYVGAFFTRTSDFDAPSFYGITVTDVKLGKVFTSGLYVGEISHPTMADQYGGPYRVWIVRETLMTDLYAAIPHFTRSYAIWASTILVALLGLAYLLLYLIVLKPSKRLSKAGNAYIASLRAGEAQSVFSEDTSSIKNEMTDLNDALFYTQEAIAEYTGKIKEAAAYEEKINADLRLAERIQGSMVPSSPISSSNFTVGGFMLPAREVGGDLYNYFEIDEDHVGFFIGDVSGKGVPASLFMAKTVTLLRLLSSKLEIEKVNRLLCQNNDELLFVTAFIGVLNHKTGLLRYVNCGHEPTFLFHDGKYDVLPANSNLPLGWDEEMEYPVEEIQLSHGDRLFLYTDGISEAMDKDGNLFGKERILDTLNQACELANTALMEAMLYSISMFVNGAEQSDDMCMLSLDYAKESLLSFEPTLDGLNKVPPFIDEFFGEKEELAFIAPIQVIADELCSNVVRYAETCGENILFTLRDDGEFIYGTVIDTGIPFNPLEDKPKHDEDKPGGLGILMASTMSDEFHYRRVGKYNVLLFAKKHTAKKK